ncbi:BTB/POZ and TAZ domain-containing protein 3-like isoform X2 [Lycium ferocissimum]|uniref:BTB/POZ and TAZ domain-containing protein 3-like isoform X2 n=1 Tax=Lycium ferocissimum TaxID=112874 RepID=UPI0028151545|nr:BTB/POZ and TAZ domain-containing protein 3-like isoform X2 [Lycium ferocissimum]
MASPEIDYCWSSSVSESFGGCFNIRLEGENSGDTLNFLEDPRSPAYNACNIPEPPHPPSGKICLRSITHRGRGKSGRVPKETRDTWDKLFKDGYGADVHIITDDGSFIPAHYTLLDWLSPENVIDVLQLARNCDAPRLILVCIRMTVSNFKTVSSSEGWKVMRRANPMLEQELLESVVDADSGSVSDDWTYGPT